MDYLEEISVEDLQQALDKVEGKKPAQRLLAAIAYKNGAALLTTSVSSAILRLFVDHAHEQGDDCVFPTERWATTFRSYAQQILSEIVVSYTYDPNLRARGIRRRDNQHHHAGRFLRR